MIHIAIINSKEVVFDSIKIEGYSVEKINDDNEGNIAVTKFKIMKIKKWQGQVTYWSDGVVADVKLKVVNVNLFFEIKNV